jgi:hypothetical protein
VDQVHQGACQLIAGEPFFLFWCSLVRLKIQNFLGEIKGLVVQASLPDLEKSPIP